MMLRTSLFCVLCILPNVFSSIPNYIKPCSVGDLEEFRKCLLKHGKEAIPHFINGDPEYKIPSLDPLSIDKVTFSPGPQLTVYTKNVQVYGLKETQLTDGRFDKENNKMFIQIFVPNVTIVGDYQAKGRILILPIEGKGKLNMQIINVQFNYTLEFENLSFESTKPVKLKETKVKFLQEHTIFNFENIINGNKLLSDNTNKVLTENWRAVHDDLSPVFSATIDEIVKSIFIGALGNTRFEEAFLP